MNNLRKRIISKIRQQLSILQLQINRTPDAPILPLECIDEIKYTIDKEFEIVVFGRKIDYETINWHCDYSSGYCYPQKTRFDKIKIFKLFNRGIDVIFPWELSRFQFGIDLAICYHRYKDVQYYTIFKSLVIDWIEKNPFLIGVNWICTMEVAIRASNWIVAAHLFKKIFWEDKKFTMLLSNSLYEHARYIETFPKKFDITGNTHLISRYSGLFIISLCFIETNDGKRWLKIAKNGLEFCMEKQICEDGTYYENSIPYHRLALELFAIPVIIGRNSNIEFSAAYYSKLFKMFEFVCAYMDSKGNAPQIGDNDSGRFFQLTNSDERNHLYLLELSQQIFENNFDAKCSCNFLFSIFRVKANKIPLSELGIKPRDCKKSVFFTEGGFYFLKNNQFDVAVFCPICNQGGHRHFDAGSFTLSHNGEQIVVDPGTGVFTSNIQIRRCFRDYSSHNFYYKHKLNANNTNYFGIVDDLEVKVISFSDNMINIRMFLDNELSVERRFILNDNSFQIQDIIVGIAKNLVSALHFTESDIEMKEDNRIKIKGLEIFISGSNDVQKEKYLYSPSYLTMEEREKIVILPGETVTIDFINLDY